MSTTILYALNAERDSANNYIGNKVVEIDYLTAEVISRGLLAGFPAFQVGSSSFDQNSGSLLLVGLDTNSVKQMIIFDTHTNTWETGFVPETVSEIACDNYAFAQNTYGTASIEEKEPADLFIYPNPATTGFTLKMHSPASKFALKISDVNGTECFSGEIQNPETEFSTQFLAKGVYFITIQNRKSTHTKKLIIQ
ncbi:MAG: T9SS type A sorting domain-containing protein [Bacteroidales bacterium]